MSPTAGFLIYSGIMPLLKTFFTIFFGYIVARKGLFPPAASRGASQITMNVSLPCLMFSSMVDAFNRDNVSAIGPLLLIAVVYMVLGFVFGILIREFFYVPRNFMQGVVVLCIMSNWGNLPNAIVVSVTQQAPFDPSTDPALGISFVSIFIFAFNLAFWCAGIAHSLSWDYGEGVPQGEDAERRYPWYEKPIGAFVVRHILRGRVAAGNGKGKGKDDYDNGHALSLDRMPTRTSRMENNNEVVLAEAEGSADPDVRLARKVSGATSFRSRRPSGTTHGAGTTIRPTLLSGQDETKSVLSTRKDGSESDPGMKKYRVPAVLAWIFRPLRALINPITLSMAVSIACALIPQLKALFVSGTELDWKAPDGRPPLVVIFETAEFVGAITVPMGLILLGASFARMKIPRPFSRLPIAAMLVCSAVKLVIMPVVGVFLVQAFVKRGLIPVDAKAERFVAMFLSGTPAAVNQLIVSSLYSPNGELDTLTAFLLIQYVLMFFSSAALTAVSLLLL